MKIRVRENNISYHFLVESKPHERIDLLITESVNIYQTKKEEKKYSSNNEDILFWRKTDETIWKFPPFYLTPLFLRQFFHDHPLCPNFKNKKPPTSTGGRKLWFGRRTFFSIIKLVFQGKREFYLFYYHAIFKDPVLFK